MVFFYILFYYALFHTECEFSSFMYFYNKSAWYSRNSRYFDYSESKYSRKAFPCFDILFPNALTKYNDCLLQYFLLYLEVRPATCLIMREIIMSMNERDRRCPSRFDCPGCAYSAYANIHVMILAPVRKIR
jgi:hypothetical protein